MAHGDDTAAARLGELASYFLHHPATGGLEGHATTVNASAPLRLGTVDHITASVREIADHTRGANPDAGPLPNRLADVYDWMREHTEHAPETVQLRAQIIEYRQMLEHCLEARDTETVRRQVRTQTCPKCGCWGLMWKTEIGRIVCSNTECVDRDGFSTTLTLARFAHHAVTTRQNLRQASAT